MKFNEWLKIREAAPALDTSGVKQPPQPGEMARKNKTRTAIKTTRAKNLGKPPKIQIAALQGVAQKLATDPNSDDDAMKDIDTEIKGIQNQAGIKA
jgi:hypothetical protein